MLREAALAVMPNLALDHTYLCDHVLAPAPATIVLGLVAICLEMIHRGKRQIRPRGFSESIVAIGRMGAAEQPLKS